MRLHRIIAAVAVVLAAGSARADWSEGSATVNAKAFIDTPWTHSFTTATDSSGLDVSACQKVTVTFDQSTGDTSTDAVVELRACPTATTAWQQCVLLRTGPGDMKDGVSLPIGSFPTANPYALVHVVTAPTGGDTAQVVLDCREDTTTTEVGSSTPADDSVTDPKMGADDFGDFSCAGTAESCTIDTNAVALGTDTTGNYAGSSSEGGAATTATALAANGANCSANTYPLGVDASGAAESCGTVASAGITDGTVVNADVNASAAIDATKLAYGGGTGISSGTVEAGMDELATEKLNASDAVAVNPALDGSVFNLSAINQSDSTEGLRVPNCTAANCANATAAGQVAYDTYENALVVGNGLQAGSPGWSRRKFFCVDEFLGVDDGTNPPSGNCTFRSFTVTGGSTSSVSAAWPAIGTMYIGISSSDAAAAQVLRTTYDNQWSPGTAGPATRFFARVNLSNVPVSGGDDYIFRIGFLDTANASEPTDGAYFEIDLTGSATKWRTVTKRGASVTREDHTVNFAAASWVDLEISCVAAGTSCAFIINDTSFTQSGTQYIPQTATPTGVGAQIARVGTPATLRYVVFDYMGVEATFAAAR